MAQANPISNIKHSSQEMDNSSYDETFGQNTVEELGYDGQNLQRRQADALLTEIDYDSGTNPVYVGIAAPGTATSAASWQIKKITYDGNGNPTSVQYAGGSSAFNQIYENRASLSYS